MMLRAPTTAVAFRDAPVDAMAPGVTYVPVDVEAARAYGIARWREEFAWPVSDAAYCALYADIDRAVAGCIASAPPAVSRAFLVKRELAFDAAHLLHAIAVIAASHDRELPVLYSVRSPWYREILAGESAGAWTGLAATRARLSPAATERSALLRARVAAGSFLRTLRMNAALLPTAPWRRPADRACAIGVPSSFVRNEARRAGWWVTSTIPAQWFSGRSVPALADADRAALVESVADFTADVRRLASACGIPCTDAHGDLLAASALAQLGEVMAVYPFVRSYAERRRANHLLLSGVGNPYQRMLAIAIREHGGRVTSFTHGGHVGLFDTTTMAKNEFALSDTFVTYTPGARELFERIRDRHPTPNGNRPTIQSGRDETFVRWRARFAHTNVPVRVRTVMLVGNAYNPWRKPQGSARFALMHLDFELALVDALTAAGYAVLYKVHPDRRLEVRGIFDAKATVIEEPFEEVAERANAYVFGNIRTTAFSIALCTNAPVIGYLAEGESPAPFPDALAALRKRCTVLSWRFDDRNRITFDPQLLTAALAVPPRAPDWTFVERYLLP